MIRVQAERSTRITLSCLFWSSTSPARIWLRRTRTSSAFPRACKYICTVERIELPKLSASISASTVFVSLGIAPTVSSNKAKATNLYIKKNINIDRKTDSARLIHQNYSPPCANSPRTRSSLGTNSVNLPHDRAPQGDAGSGARALESLCPGLFGAGKPKNTNARIFGHPAMSYVS